MSASEVDAVIDTRLTGLSSESNGTGTTVATGVVMTGRTIKARVGLTLVELGVAVLATEPRGAGTGIRPNTLHTCAIVTARTVAAAINWDFTLCSCELGPTYQAQDPSLA